jgi:hypothetical protein
MTDTTEVERGRWYPAPAPALEGETDDTYTNRLLGSDGTDRCPYDHPRNRQCSIGYHMECSARIGGGCGCPCHFDVGVPADADVNAEAASQIAALYDLPDTTGRRVMFETSKALRAGEANNAADLIVVLGRVYDSTITEGFAIDAFNIHAHYATAELEPGAAG